MSKMTNKMILLGVWSMFLTLLAYGQDNNLKRQLQLLEKASEHKFSFDNKGFEKIKNAQFFTKNGDANVFTITSKNVHLVDINNDGQKDIIYQENRPYPATVLFVKKGNDFVEIWNGSGALVDIREGKHTTIYLLTSAIGCFDMNMLSELTVNSNNTIIDNTIGLYSELKMENINNTFEQNIISGILRTKPIVDDHKKTDPCSGDLKTGNQLQTIDNKEVTVIKNQNDWSLVVLKEKNHSIIGWVKI